MPELPELEIYRERLAAALAGRTAEAARDTRRLAHVDVGDPWRWRVVVGHRRHLTPEVIPGLSALGTVPGDGPLDALTATWATTCG